MTDSIKAFTVALEPGVREDDAEAIINAMKMIKGVVSVQPHKADWEHAIAVDDARRALRKEMRDVLWP